MKEPTNVEVTADTQGSGNVPIDTVAQIQDFFGVPKKENTVSDVVVPSAEKAVVEETKQEATTKQVEKPEDVSDVLKALNAAVAGLNATEKPEPQEVQTPQTQKVDFADTLFEGHKPEDILSDPTAFKSFMGKAFSLIRNQVGETVQKAVVQRMVSVITKSVQEQVSLSGIISRFYGDNPHLVGLESVVSTLANKAASENPTHSLEQILSTVSKQLDVLRSRGEKTTTRPAGLPITSNATKDSVSKPTEDPKITALQNFLSMHARR